MTPRIRKAATKQKSSSCSSSTSKGVTQELSALREDVQAQDGKKIR
jgi:hypothetical protein